MEKKISLQADSLNKNGSTNQIGGSIKSRQGAPNPAKANSTSNKSRPKYLECWGDADKPFANITENNATAKSTAMMTLSMIESNLLPERYEFAFQSEISES